MTFGRLSTVTPRYFWVKRHSTTAPFNYLIGVICLCLERLKSIATSVEIFKRNLLIQEMMGNYYVDGLFILQYYQYYGTPPTPA